MSWYSIDSTHEELSTQALRMCVCDTCAPGSSTTNLRNSSQLMWPSLHVVVAAAAEQGELRRRHSSPRLLCLLPQCSFSCWSQ